MGTGLGALIATRDITRIDIFVPVGTGAGAPPIEFQPVSVRSDDDRTWRGTGLGALIATRDITPMKYSYPWAPGPVPLHLNFNLYPHNPTTIVPGGAPASVPLSQPATSRASTFLYPWAPGPVPLHLNFNQHPYDQTTIVPGRP